MPASAPAMNKAVYTLFATSSLFALVMAQSSGEPSLPLVIQNTLSGSVASASLATSPVTHPTSEVTESVPSPTGTTSSTLSTVLYLVIAAAVFILFTMSTTVFLYYCRRRRNSYAAKKEAPMVQPSGSDLPPPSPNAMFDLEDPYRREWPPSPGSVTPPMSQTQKAHLSVTSAWDSDATLTPAQANAYLKSISNEKDKGGLDDGVHGFAAASDPFGSVNIDKSNAPAVSASPLMKEGLRSDYELSIYAVTDEGSTLDTHAPHAR